MENENQTLSEYLYLILAERYFSLEKKFNISLSQNLLGETSYRQLHNKISYINKYLQYNVLAYEEKNSEDGKSIIKYNLQANLSFAEIIFSKRLFEFTLDFQNRSEVFANNRNIDVNNLYFSATLYLLYMGLISFLKKQKQPLDELSQEVCNVALYYRHLILKEYCGEFLRDFESLNEKLLKSLYTHTLEFVFPPQLFKIAEILDSNKLGISTLDNYNRKILLDLLASKCIYSSDVRAAVYDCIQKILSETNCSFSTEDLNKLNSVFDLYNDDFKQFQSYQHKYFSYTVDELISEIAKLEN